MNLYCRKIYLIFTTLFLFQDFFYFTFLKIYFLFKRERVCNQEEGREREADSLPREPEAGLTQS